MTEKLPPYEPDDLFGGEYDPVDPQKVAEDLKRRLATNAGVIRAAAAKNHSKPETSVAETRYRELGGNVPQPSSDGSHMDQVELPEVSITSQTPLVGEEQPTTSHYHYLSDEEGDDLLIGIHGPKQAAQIKAARILNTSFSDHDKPGAARIAHAVRRGRELRARGQNIPESQQSRLEKE